MHDNLHTHDDKDRGCSQKDGTPSAEVSWYRKDVLSFQGAGDLEATRGLGARQKLHVVCIHGLLPVSIVAHQGQQPTQLLLCRSWNLRQAALRAAEAQSQNALLSAHEAQLQNLSFVVQSGHASILERIDATRSLGSNISAPCASTVNSNRQGILPRGRTKNISAQTLRLALPRWLAHRVWEFAVHDMDGAWNFRVRPINIRPYGTFAFDILRSGNVEAVRKLLASGELSVSDHENDLFESRHKSLLFVSPTWFEP